MTDKDILELFITKNDRIDSNKTKKIATNDSYKEIKEYLDSRFSDISNSYTEIINRIKYGIETAPVCEHCGAPVEWISKDKYRRFCSHSCKNKHLYNEIKEKSIKNHGSAFNREKFKNTINDKFGKENWCNREKFKQTFSLKTTEELQEINNKKRQTNLTLYGDENYNNREQSRYTTFLHYGVDQYFKTNECKEKSKLSYIKNKEEIDQKIRQTKIDKYGTCNNVEKIKQTKLLRYNDQNFNNREKAKQTCLDKYGVKNIYNLDFYKDSAHSPEALEKIINTSLRKFGTRFPIQSQIIQEKIIETKRRNHTFNTSKPEDKTYELLKEKYSFVIRQYSSDKYPFACDFYIPSEDLYIECNYHWTHGGKAFEGTEKDMEKLEIWKSKHTKFYDNAVYTWTIRDVNKREIAKKNKLNWIEFWNEEQIKSFLERK